MEEIDLKEGSKELVLKNAKKITTKISEIYKQDLTILEQLHIVKNYVTTDTFINIIPEVINLKILNLTANSLTYIPKEIGSLIYLETLILNNNKISVIENLSPLKKLTKLEIRSNLISSLSDDFYLLLNNNNLKTITVSCNLIVNDTIKFSEINCKSCIEIGLFGNYLGYENDDDKNEIFLKEFCTSLANSFTSIKKIFLGGNHFSNCSFFKPIVLSVLKLEYLEGESVN